MRFLLIVILLLMLSRDVHARENIFGIRYDYILHFQSGLIISVVSTQWGTSICKIKEDYGLFSIGIPAIAGIAKEYYDYKHNNNIILKDSSKDLGFTLLGGICGKLLSYSF